MKTLALPKYLALCLFTLSLTVPAIADTLIFDNSVDSPYEYPEYPQSYIEMLDYGSCSGGLVTKFEFSYSSTSSGTVWIRFYQYTNRSQTGTFIKEFSLFLPATGGYTDTYEYVIPAQHQFELPNGYFGYSFEFSNANSRITLAAGGAGIDENFWQGSYGNFYLYSFPSVYNFYFKLFSGPPASETCDIAGYKFDDTDGDGTWDAGEPGLPGWEIYVDKNDDGIYQISEPNATTDATGAYLFDNLEFDDPNVAQNFIVREILKDNWTQTYPGGPDYKHTIVAEPNNVYENNNFGNTEQVIPSDIKLYGYVETVGGQPVNGVKVELFNAFTSLGFYDYTDEQGYYEITVSTPFTGYAEAAKIGWQQYNWGISHTDLTTDYQQDFQMLNVYGGGDGSQNDPYQIYTPQHIDFMARQSMHWDLHFVLMNDIDLSGMDVAPIGLDIFHAFEGTFDGNLFSIHNYSKDMTESVLFASLFGIVNSPDAEIKNLTMVNPQINAPNASMAAPVIGQMAGGTVTNCHVSGGAVIGKTYAGGLIAKSDPYDSALEPGAFIEDCSSSCDVSTAGGTMTYAGGLIGMHRGQVHKSFATGDVSGNDNVGGFAGRVSAAFGNSPLNGSVDDCYARGSASGSGDVGGFVGYNEMAQVTNCYSTGWSESFIGGFCANRTGATFTGCFWDETTSTRQFSNGGTGLDTASMMAVQTYEDAGWDFENTWRICNGTNYPRLQWEPELVGDFGCPDGVEVADLMVLCEEWLAETLTPSADIAPDGGDGMVDMQDWTRMTDAWQASTGQAGWNPDCDLVPSGLIDTGDLTVFADQWLYRSAHDADIAPAGAPDGKVNILDFALLTENWMLGTD